VIKVNNKYLYKSRTVIVTIYHESCRKRGRVEVSDDLNDRKNPFWINDNELPVDVDELNELVERHEKINPESTKNFVTFDI
jgi:hypothetical protein